MLLKLFGWYCCCCRCCCCWYTHRLSRHCHCCSLFSFFIPDSNADASFFFPTFLVYCFPSLEFVFSYTTCINSCSTLIVYKTMKTSKSTQNESKTKTKKKRKYDYYGVLCDCELELRARSVKFDHYIIISRLFYFIFLYELHISLLWFPAKQKQIWCKNL